MSVATDKGDADDRDTFEARKRQPQGVATSRTCSATSRTFYGERRKREETSGSTNTHIPKRNDDLWKISGRRFSMTIQTCRDVLIVPLAKGVNITHPDDLIKQRCLLKIYRS